MVAIDLKPLGQCGSEACRKLANMQVNHASRVCLKDSGRVVTISMNKDDNEAVKPEAIKSRSDAKRQRNEVRFVEPELCLGPRESGEWRMDVRIEQVGGWAVDGGSFYHVVQIKSPDVNRPIFTVGVKNNHLAVYKCQDHDPSFVQVVPVADVLNKWIEVRVRIDRANKTVSYVVHGHKGSYSCKSVPVKEMYAKIGQYRSFPNPVKTATSSSYRNVGLQKI